MKKKISLIASIIFVVLIITTLPMGALEQSGFNTITSSLTLDLEVVNTDTIVSIVPSTQTVSTGETFTVSVYCDPTEPFEGFEFDLDFNATILQANSVTEGDIFDGYDTWFNDGTNDNINGYINNVYCLITEEGDVSDPGYLANISFTAGSVAGTSVLNLCDIGISNATGYIPIDVYNGSVTIGEGGNQPPSAGFTYEPSNPETSETVYFNSTSTDIDGIIDNWTWDMDDGTTLYGEEVTHQYSDDGSYDVQLIVTDNDSATDSDTQTVNVGNQPPSAGFTYEPGSPLTYQTVYFNSTSTDSDGSIVNWTWDFGDGAVSYGEFVTHQYGDNGVYTVNLTVKDEDDAIASDTTTVTIADSGDDDDDDYTPPANQSPVANASASNSYGVVGESINFDGSLSTDDGSITNYTWDFDDKDAMGYGKTTTHTFTSSRTYHVTLTVTDDVGATDEDTIDVIISKTNNPPTKPDITGPTTGHQNIAYEYSAVSIDTDNDTIQYTFDWNDGGSDTVSDFLPNGTMYKATHKWTLAGIYTINVIATDNKTTSKKVNLTVLIDAEYVSNLGHLLDNNGDETYDSFYSNITKTETSVKKQDNGNYSIDTDGDGSWDYSYNPIEGTASPIEKKEKETADGTSEFPTGMVLVMIMALIIIVVIVYLYKKKYF